jgi:hypothetical protein
MELNKEMLNCLKLPHTIINGWEGSCSNCEVFAKGEVIMQGGICIISRQCLEWLEEQEKLLDL